ncbi:MAG: periplasmic heavy metal sensor [Hyphomicrobium sp.]|nr:periplasmic heavy metal sensor [Hyphomicrobium sp.]
MTTDGRETSAQRPRWLYAGLIASLAVNLLVIGGMGAAFWHHRHGGPGPWRGDDAGLMGFVRKLPKERQDVVRNDVKLARETLKPLRDAARSAWTDANNALAAEPFSADAAKGAFQRMTDAEATLKTAISSVLIDTAAKLTPDERRVLTQWRDKRKPGKRDRGPPD